MGDESKASPVKGSAGEPRRQQEGKLQQAQDVRQDVERKSQYPRLLVSDPCITWDPRETSSKSSQRKGDDSV
jgi:hypothetical protein